MNEDYTIFKLREDDFDILIPLIHNCFGIDVNLDYFLWKYKNNPAGFVEGYYAKHANGDVAAYYGVIPEHYVIGGRERLIYQSCDTMTHSDHRRKGLFRMLATHCYDNLRKDGKLFVIGFGGATSTPGFIKFGWRELFKIRNYFYPSTFNRFKFNVNVNRKDIVHITDYNDIKHLINRGNEAAHVRSVRNPLLFEWRVSNPRYAYQTIAIRDKSGAFNSYATYYEESDKIVLFDFYVGELKLGRQLFLHLKSLLHKGHKGIVAFVQERSMLSRTLRKLGFIANPLNFGPLSWRTPFILYVPETEFHGLEDPGKWLIGAFEHDAM